eukprot:COSAG05_NODE_179_length_14870_cov_351.155846_2_plen_107_part_00
MREGISEKQATESLVREAFAAALGSKTAGLRRSVEMGALYAGLSAAHVGGASPKVRAIIRSIYNHRPAMHNLTRWRCSCLFVCGSGRCRRCCGVGKMRLLWVFAAD